MPQKPAITRPKITGLKVKVNHTATVTFHGTDPGNVSKAAKKKFKA
jgi:hypothetical protein